MRKFTHCILFITLLLFVFAPRKTNATTYTITVNSNFFSPSSQNVLVGDTIHFQWVSGSHTTTCDPGTLAGTSYPPGFFGWDALMNSGNTDYYVAITQPGTYIYGCIPHFLGGMQGTITAATGYKYWYGILGGGDGISWADPLNWLDGTVPSTADSVMLDNSYVTFTYIVTLPGGTTNTQVSKIVIQPTLPNYIYLTLPSSNTSTADALKLGNGSGSPYDFVLHKHAIFNFQSGAASGTPFTFANASDSIQLLDSGLWNHNGRTVADGIANKLSQQSITRNGIFRYDMLTTSNAELNTNSVTYGSLQLYGLSGSGGVLMGKKYISAAGSLMTVRGNFYMDEYCYDSIAMTGNLNIQGDFTMFGKIVYGPVANPQTINFNGTSLQTITLFGLSAVNSQISGKVTFNNPAGFFITQPMYIDSVTMTSGNINTGGGAWLGVGYDAANPGTLTRTGGIVTGQMERWYLAGVTSDSLIFPVGTSTVLKQARVRFSTAPTTAGRIGIKYIDNGIEGSDLPVALNDGGYSVTRRSNSYWLMTGTFLTGGGIDVALDGNGQLGITDPENLRVVWSNDGTTFSLLGNHKLGNASIGRRTDIGLYFSNFYLGGNSSFNPLPVELSSFVATTIKNEVILDWVTGHELNNNMFEVQRAVKNSEIIGDYTTVGIVKSKGNSNTSQEYKYSDKNLSVGNYAYRLKQIDYNGNFEYFILNSQVIIGQPNGFSVSQNYPNPFNPSTIINYEMPFDGLVKLVVFDNLGREVKTLVNGNVNAGYYKTEFNATGLPSGVYFYRINASSGSKNFEKVFKMMLVK